jgi:hypothetical protein
MSFRRDFKVVSLATLPLLDCIASEGKVGDVILDFSRAAIAISPALRIEWE